MRTHVACSICYINNKNMFNISVGLDQYTLQMMKTRTIASPTHAPTEAHALTTVTATTLAHAHLDTKAFSVKQVNGLLDIFTEAG